MSKFIIPLYDGVGSAKKFTGHTLVNAEGCAGLYVHRTHYDTAYGYVSPWRVSTVTGQRAYVGRLNSRQEARSMAHKLSAVLPAKVLSGEWSGADWATHDPDGARAYQYKFYGMREYSA